MGGAGGGSGVIVGGEIFMTARCLGVEGYSCCCEELAAAFILRVKQPKVARSHYHRAKVLAQTDEQPEYSCFGDKVWR